MAEEEEVEEELEEEWEEEEVCPGCGLPLKDCICEEVEEVEEEEEEV